MASNEKFGVNSVMQYQKKIYFGALGLQKDSPPAWKFTANKDIEKTEKNIFHLFRLTSVLSLASGHIKKIITRKSENLLSRIGDSPRLMEFG